MLLLLVAYLGGVLTILSPCILPVLPFVFARTGRPFVTSTLPMLVGMAVTFAIVATLAAVGGSWAVHANTYGRWAALALLALFGLALLLPSLADRMTRPLVALGNRLSNQAGQGGANEVVSALVLGVAVGFLWAPCAGPILGLVLTGAALAGANVGSSLALLAYALGAATSLALALLAGGRVFKAMKKSLGFSETARRILGALVLAAVVAIASGMDTGLLTRISAASTTRLESGLITKFHLAGNSQSAAIGAETMPPLDGAIAWINSPPLTREQLKGKLVLVDFWTYSCINCLRSVPYVEAWQQKYGSHGLVIIGVHTPEFAFERELPNVQAAVKQLGVTYPVAVDSNDTIWRAFNNSYWPADYLFDGSGKLVDQHFGEGEYAASEQAIQKQLALAGDQNVPGGLVTPNAQGAQAAADVNDIQSPETYINYNRGTNFASPEQPKADAAQNYTTPAVLTLNQWALAGGWTIGSEDSAPQAGGALSFRFHARDLHMVLGPDADGKPVRFRITIDGKAPGDDHGVDTDADGNGTITSQRLYQLIRQHGAVVDHTFTIEFIDAGAKVYTFTFG